ncbi:caspase family protein [Dyella japonica]|uniref:Peptidase C14 n=1 Tax=Dyella japonica A8 TaxID=1217721 RepID=A0A075JXB6_9GAMM|nr:caspase family protein [Dyella japonica]AIF46102.1 peptidase C14 [Dyella japonica A8]
MRIALIVGIDFYEHLKPLTGCVADAYSVQSVLSRHGDGTVNFDTTLLTSVGPEQKVDRRQLKEHVRKLFNAKAEIALFYFAGHGQVEATGGYVVASDATQGDEGLSLSEIMTLANASPAQNKIIVLDSCYSGAAGAIPGVSNLASLSEGMTILTASTADQPAIEEDGRGVFTTLLVDALFGGAANLTGDITPGSVYAHVDQSLGGWEQRPVFKTNVQEFVSLRKVAPPIDLSDLQRISEFFPFPGAEFGLDPSFEPEMKGRDPGMPNPDPENTWRFAILQRYNRLNLVVPVNAPHMWHAAMESKSCKLTVLGEHYRRLVAKGRL